MPPLSYVKDWIDLSRNNLAVAIPAYIATAVICLFLYRLCLHPLAGFPGPVEAKLSGTWRDRRYWRGTWHDDILQAHERYGPIVRIAPNELSVVDEQATKQLYGHGSKSVKTDWYATWDFGGKFPHLFSTRSKAQHSFLRKRVSPAYSLTSILRYEQYIQPCLDTMMSHLKTHADQGDTIVMSDWVSWLAFDVIGTLAYGQPFGQLETESDTLDLAKTIHAGFFILSNVGNWIGQSRIVQSSAFNSIMAAIGSPSPMLVFEAWTKEVIQERRLNSAKSERYEMLQHFMEMKNETNDGPAPEQDVRAEANSMV